MSSTPLFHKRHPAVGARPGTLVVPDDAAALTISLIRYGRETLHLESDIGPDQIRSSLTEPGCTWVDVQGIGDETILRSLGDLFQLHPLLLEDMVNVPQRPKVERYGELTLLVARMFVPGNDSLAAEQVSIVFGHRFVLTVQQRPGDVFDPIRRRLDRGGGVIREQGSDYLAYALLDTIVDAYYPVLEGMSDRLEALEEEVIQRPEHDSVARIYALKRQLLEFRRTVWPQREALGAAVRDDEGGFTAAVRVYLRDTYDHCVQVIDVIETYREMAGGLLDVYLSTESNRMNEVMKVLTIMASIFIPLTFIAGVYGMNFEHMPELQRRNAYPVVLFVMAGSAVGMIWWFYRKGWLRRR
jgi:magnesium transporter